MNLGVTIGISIISAATVSFLTYFFGLRLYLKQKEREEVNDVYIQNGIDRMIKAFDQACFICEFNYAKAARILEYFNKFQGDISLEKKITQKIFSEMKPMIVAPENTIYKLQILTGNNETVSAWVVETLADYLKYNDYLRYELFLELEYYFKNPDKFQEKRRQFFDELQKRINEIHKKAISLNEPLKAHLLNIKIRVDEMQVSKTKDLDKIPKDKQIKEILEEIEKDYKKIQNSNPE